jgi:hypothetical protein
LRGWIGEQGVVRDHNQIRMSNSAAIEDGLTCHAGKRGQRGTTTLSTVHGRILDDKPRVKGCRADNTAGRLHPLTTATVKAHM